MKKNTSVGNKSTGVGWRLRCAWLLLAIVAGVGLSCDGLVSEQPIDAAREAIERTPVRSSVLESVGYDQASNILEIEFSGGEVYQYFDVPPEVSRGLMAAESHGRYFHRHVRGAGYRYTRTDR